ncbi:hypothetical protein ACI65C_006669 [Semiaphis heraclei]
MVDKMSFSEMMIMIEKFHLEIQTVSKSVRKKTEENKEKKISLNRLNTQIQKQIMYKKKLTNEMYDIDKPKHEYEDELNDKLHNKKILSSKIMEQFEEIQRLLAEKDDKNEFIDQQMKFSNGNGNSTHKNIRLLSKRSENEKKDKYYKSLCKTLMIEDILSNNLNIQKAKTLTEENIILSEKHQNSKKALKMALENVELWKYRYVSYFDESYDRPDKTKIVKVADDVNFQSINQKWIYELLEINGQDTNEKCRALDDAGPQPIWNAL